MAAEIERRYLLSSLPELDYERLVFLKQGYIRTGDYEVRLRSSQISCGGGSFVLCRKEGTGLTREELEEPLTKAQFDLLWPLTSQSRLTKTRHIISDGGELFFEIDLFEPPHAPLVLMEVELPYARYPFSIPTSIAPLVIREVTGEIPYLNSSLARHGLPSPQ